MDSAPGLGDAGREGLLDGVEAWKFGQQRRMNVEDTAGIGGDDGWSEHAHEAGEAEELHGSRLQRIQNGGAKEIPIPVVWYHDVRNIGPLGAFNGPRLRVVGQQQRDGGVELSSRVGIEQGLKISPLAGGEHSDHWVRTSIGGLFSHTRGYT